MSTIKCKYKAGLELARYKSRHLLVWQSRAHMDQKMQFREKDAFVFSSQDYSHEVALRTTT